MRHDLLRSAHRKRMLQMQLQICWIVLLAEGHPVFFEDAKDHPVHDKPTVFPEESKKSLHLVQWYDLCEQCHDPILTQIEQSDSFIA